MSKQSENLPENNSNGSSKKSISKNPILRFSSMAIQMGLIIGLAAWGGIELDARVKNEKPIYTIILCLLGIGISLYLIIKEALKLSNDDK